MAFFFQHYMLSEINCVLLLKSGGQDQERRHKKRRGEFYSIQTSLIVAALKKMLPIGLNMCTPGDQELISLAKTRYLLVRHFMCSCTSDTFYNDLTGSMTSAQVIISIPVVFPQRDTDEEVKDHIRQNLHLREKVNSSDLMSSRFQLTSAVLVVLHLL